MSPSSSTMRSSIVLSPARTLASASWSSPRSASLAAAIASDTRAKRRTTFDVIASRSRWYPTRSSWGCSLMPCSRQGDPELLGGPCLEPLVVHLAIRRAADGVNREHSLRRLVGGQLVLHVGDDAALVERGPGGELDDRGDGLAELLVRDADGHRVDDAVVGLQHLLDLLREHL